MQLTVKTICPDPTTLAQQLTHIELERLSHIGPEEFVQVRLFINRVLVDEVPVQATRY